MASSLSNVIDYCRTINGSKGFNDTKTQFINEITQDYNIAREDTIYRFDILINSIDAKDVYINDSEMPIKGVIDISKKQTADTEMEEKIQVYPNQLKRGDYIKFKVNDTDILRTYLIKSKIDKKHGYDEGIFEEINYILKWMYKGVPYKIPCIVANQTKYTLGVSGVANSIIEGSSRYQILIGYNDFSKVIDEGQRFIFNNNAWKTTQVDFISEKGLVSLLLGQDSINTEIDDVDNEIAGAYENKHTYTYDMPTSFEVSNGSEFTINYSIKDENGKNFDYSLVTVTTSDNTLVQVTNNNGVISVKGLAVGTGSVKLSVPIGSTSKDFDILFEVRDVVENKVDYQYSFSQGTILKTYMSTTVSINRLINSVIDSSATINYSLDSMGTTLLNVGNISITRKTNTSFQIKNVNVGTSKSFVITFIDSSDGTIVSTQTINLSGM